MHATAHPPIRAAVATSTVAQLFALSFLGALPFLDALHAPRPAGLRHPRSSGTTVLRERAGARA